MSILIKGMEMPTRCGRCDMRIPVYDDGIFDHYECCITAAIIDNLGEKMEDCPLVPVPPHGRLIDAEANIESLERCLQSPENDLAEFSYSYARAFLSECPTIIEADVTDINVVNKTAEEGNG